MKIKMKKNLFVSIISVLSLVGCVGGSNSSQGMKPGNYNVTYSNGLITAITSPDGTKCSKNASAEPGILEVASSSGIGIYNSGSILEPVYSGTFTNPINNLPSGKPCFTAYLDQTGDYPPACGAINSTSYIEFVSCINYSTGVGNTFKAQYFVYTPDDNTGENILVLSGSVTGTN